MAHKVAVNSQALVRGKVENGPIPEKVKLKIDTSFPELTQLRKIVRKEGIMAIFSKLKRENLM